MWLLVCFCNTETGDEGRRDRSVKVVTSSLALWGQGMTVCAAPKEVTFSVQRSTSRLFYSESVSKFSTPVTTDLLAKVYHDSGKQSNNLKRLVSLLSMYVSNSHAYMCVCVYTYTHIYS